MQHKRNSFCLWLLLKAGPTGSRGGGWGAILMTSLTDQKSTNCLSDRDSQRRGVYWGRGRKEGSGIAVASYLEQEDQVVAWEDGGSLI